MKNTKWPRRASMVGPTAEAYAKPLASLEWRTIARSSRRERMAMVVSARTPWAAGFERRSSGRRRTVNGRMEKWEPYRLAVPWTTICGFGGGCVSVDEVFCSVLDAFADVTFEAFGAVEDAWGCGRYVPMVMSGACQAKVAVPAPAAIMRTSCATI